MEAEVPVAELLPPAATFFAGRLTAAGLCKHTNIRNFMAMHFYSFLITGCDYQRS